jgi:hypothetical protein
LNEAEHLGEAPAKAGAQSAFLLYFKILCLSIVNRFGACFFALLRRGVPIFGHISDKSLFLLPKASNFRQFAGEKTVRFV